MIKNLNKLTPQDFGKVCFMWAELTLAQRPGYLLSPDFKQQLATAFPNSTNEQARLACEAIITNYMEYIS